MTDDKIANISRAMGTVLAVIILLLAIVAYGFGQDDHDHKSVSFKRFDNIRLNPPAKITGIIHTEQGERIEWVSYDKYEIRNGAFTLSKDTQKDPKVKKGTWTWFVYCVEDEFVYAVYPLSDKQKQGLK